MIELIFPFILILLLLAGIKGTFWGGPFAPNSGWSKRQLARMDQGKSPWTLLCAITHRRERQQEIQESCKWSAAVMAEIQQWSAESERIGKEFDRRMAELTETKRGIFE